MTTGERLFACRKCHKSGDIRWLISHGHSRLGSWLLGSLMNALDGWTELKRQGRQGRLP